MVYWLAFMATKRQVRGSIPGQGIVMNCLFVNFNLEIRVYRDLNPNTHAW
jgi:hypothetical protein